MPEQGERQRVVTTSSCIMRWSNYCQWPGGPGCRNAWPDSECCGEGDWYVEKHELYKTKQRFESVTDDEARAL